MATNIRLKHSATQDKVPLPTDLLDGEVALNTNVNSPALYMKDSAGNIVKLAGEGAIGGTPATETAAGIAELATQAETDAGTDDERIVTPLKLATKLAGAGTGGTGNFGYWNRTGTVVSPTNAGDAIQLSATGTAPATGAGIYSPAADQLALSTNGAGRLFVDASGRVGIGTASPTGDLTVSDNGANGLEFYADYASVGQSGITSYNRSTSQRTDLYISTEQTIFATSGSEAARIDASGRLLVGTSSDSGGALLQVNGDRVRIATAKTPASATDTGTTGEVCWDANYVYVCTATNTWKRSALSTW